MLVFGAGNFDISVVGGRQYRTVMQLQHGCEYVRAVNMLDAGYRSLSAESNGFVSVYGICNVFGNTYVIRGVYVICMTPLSVFSL